MLRSLQRHLRRLFRTYIHQRRIDPALITQETPQSRQFAEQLQANLARCSWLPHPKYSVFTQYDAGYYTSMREMYVRKYRCFYAVAQTIQPRRLIELGTHAGSSADAYLNGWPAADYTGIDQFVEGLRNEATDEPWDPYGVATTLLSERGFRFRLIKANLREVRSLPGEADMVVVDAAHDFDNEYADLQLALTAKPDWIFVDDAVDRRNAGAALARFLAHDVRDRVAFTVPVDYIEGGLVIRLKPG